TRKSDRPSVRGPTPLAGRLWGLGVNAPLSLSGNNRSNHQNLRSRLGKLDRAAGLLGKRLGKPRTGNTRFDVAPRRPIRQHFPKARIECDFRPFAADRDFQALSRRLGSNVETSSANERI